MTVGNESAPAGDARSRKGASDEHVVAEVLRQLKGLRYGSITLVVQDGAVIQIDRTEKVRLR